MKTSITIPGCCQKLVFLILLNIFQLCSIVINAQENLPPMQLLIKTDSSFLIVDDTPGCWYTFELKADTMGLIDDNVYYFDHKIIQIGAMRFDNGRILGTMESRPAEVRALSAHQEWELKHQVSSFQSKLQYNQKFYVNKKGKPFLIWWYKIPESKTPFREIKSKTQSTPELKATYQLYLDCITQSNTCVSISIPVLENEDLIKEFYKMTIIANTFNSYSGSIDLDILYERIKNGNPYVFRDAMGPFEIELPDWFNVSKSEPGCLKGAFPEKDNILDAALVRWEYKNDSSDFQKFTSKHGNDVSKAEKHNYQCLLNNEQIRREFFTSRDPFFYYEYIFINSKDLYCFIQFYSTRFTYKYNLSRLDELISKINNLSSKAQTTNLSLRSVKP
jgi:hypothetical protein